jgi:hypothetical protein
MDDILLTIAKISGGVTGFFIGLLLGAAIGAAALRIAAVILGYGKLQYFTAFKAALLANFVALVLQFGAGFNYGWTAAMSRMAIGNGRYGPSFPESMAFAFSPIFYLLLTVIVLATTALVFCRMLPPGKDDRPMSFQDALTLASVYHAFTVMFVMLVGVFVFVIFLFIWEVT